MNAVNGNGMRTYRGSSLDELLPRIREELGPDAIITCSREGVVGGIGGFFGKRCVEVEAEPQASSSPGPTPAVPARAVANAYDWPSDIEGLSESDPDTGSLIDALLAQASPFADELVEAVERENRVAVSAAEDPAALQAALERARLAPWVAEAIVKDARRRQTMFAPDEPLTAEVRRLLARRIPVDAGESRRKRRRIALVGAAGVGKTLTTAKLCQSYARSGASVCALSLERTRRAIQLATISEPLGIEFEIASCPEALELTRRKLRGMDLVVADTPRIDPSDPAGIESVARLLEALDPTETHLVVPLGSSYDSVRLLLGELTARARVDALLVTREDEADAASTPVGLALSEKLPISYIARGSSVGAGVRPADAEELARLVLA